MSFRDNLWNLGDKSFRICLPSGSVWVIVLQGKYWGIWRLAKTSTKWLPLEKNPWTVAWSLKFNGETTTWDRKDLYKRLRDKKPAEMFTGFVRKWTKDQDYKQNSQWLFNWAQAAGGQDAQRALLSWHKDGLKQLERVIRLNSLAYRTRLAKNLAKHQPRTIVALLRKQHPRATRKSIKLLLNNGEALAPLLSATPSITNQDLEQRDWCFAKGYGANRYKQWLAVRRRYPRRPHLVREVMFLEQHFNEHVAICGQHLVVIPEEIHFDMERLPNLAAVRRMEGRIRTHRLEAIAPRIAEARRHWRRAYNAEFIASEDKRQRKIAAHLRDLPLLEGFMNEPEGVKLLVTSEEFQTEGNIMKHCVGSYANSTGSLFYSIDRPEGRATLQVVPTETGGSVRQLYGKYNQPVSPELRSVITDWATKEFVL